MRISAGQATDPSGQVATIERDVVRSPQKLFLLALADGTVGQLRGKGFVDGAGRLKDTGFYSDGRLAYYLKGTIAGKYLVTSAYSPWGGTFTIGVDLTPGRYVLADLGYDDAGAPVAGPEQIELDVS